MPLGKAVHWLCVDGTVPYFIVFFNFETREVGEIPGPAQVVLAHPYANDFFNLGNRLSIFDRLTEATKFNNVWVMKEYGVKDSWSRELHHCLGCVRPPLVFYACDMQKQWGSSDG
ncbi:hypothetical protein HanPSC8_Chr07g0272231 [Helianthus annuus]|nr:hypothetical protein HanIR_Chr07g0303081 [Helianthus annuus]KAJ0903642.1 hypothetical protein HanPSC8_Chr07g0272231 [Helianthus annuus]